MSLREKRKRKQNNLSACGRLSQRKAVKSTENRRKTNGGYLRKAVGGELSCIGDARSLYSLGQIDG